MGGGEYRFRVTLWVSAGVAALTALLVVPFPFGGDQALFAVFARMMGDGSLLYVEIWDVKQPGVFWFFGLAGAWNGYSEIGIHLVEALLWIGGSIGLTFMSKPRLRREWIAALFPVAAAGIFFATAAVGNLTQVESLMALPLASVVLLLADEGNSRRKAFAAGLVTGVIALFKFLTVLAPIAVLAVAAIVRRGEVSFRDLFSRLLAPFAVGSLLPLLALAVWVAMSGVVDEVLFTWFEYPPQVLGIEPRPLSRLLDSFVWFGIAFGSVGLLALFRLIARPAYQRRLTYLAFAGVAGAVLVALLQIWWAYLFLLAVGPLTILALQGLDDLWEHRWRKVGLPVVVLALVPALLLAGEKAIDLAGLIGGESLEEYREFSVSYRGATEAVELGGIGEGDNVYVLGDPLVLQISGADQSIPVNGWSPEFWTADVWRWVGDDLQRPGTELLLIENWAARLAEERAPWLLDEIDLRYVELASDDGGTWYVPR